MTGFLIFLHNSIPGAAGVSGNPADGFRVDLDGISRLATDAEILAALKAWRVDQISKSEESVARRKILAVLPQWKQNNLTARATELIDKRATDGLSEAESSELSAIKTAWQPIKSIRAASNAMESWVSAQTSVQVLFDFDPSNPPESCPNWPQI